MFRGTTPTHKFNLPFGEEYISNLIVTYTRNGAKVIEKRIGDVTFDGNTLIVNLTQEETLKFQSDSIAKVQVRVLTTNGKVLASKIIEFHVNGSLNTEVL